MTAPIRGGVLCALLMAGGAALAETAHDEGDPWCDDLEIGSAGAVNCALPSLDNKILYFTYAPGDWGSELTVSQFDHEGELLAQSETPVTVEDVPSAPELRDITDDGIPELFIPTSAGMANITHEVWMANGSGIYIPVGTIFSFGVQSLEPENGFIETATRTNAAEYVETVQQVTITGIRTAYELTVNYADRTCTLSEGQAFAEVGRSADEIVADCLSREWE